jgi:uncharacterized protein (TIGR00725 family)
MGVGDPHPIHVPRKPVVAVIGASSAGPGTLDIAEEVGSLIGLEHWHLLTGGGGGVMEAACKGFQSVKVGESGIAIGILPSDDTAFANRFLDIAIPTGLGIARNAVIARTANALVAVGGCSGTLSEMALAWQLGRPVAACMESGGWAEKLGGTAIDDRFAEPVFAARTARDAISFVKSKVSSNLS